MAALFFCVIFSYNESNSLGFALYSKKEGIGYLFSDGVLDDGSEILFSE